MRLDSMSDSDSLEYVVYDAVYGDMHCHCKVYRTHHSVDTFAPKILLLQPPVVLDHLISYVSLEMLHEPCTLLRLRHKL